MTKNASSINPTILVKLAFLFITFLNSPEVF